MPAEALLESEYAVLLSHSAVLSIELVRYSANRLDGYLRARCTLTNGDYLEIALHITASGLDAEIDDYRYQWMDAGQTRLHRCWDNTPHFPELPGFPHHCHVGSEGTGVPSSPMNLAQLLDEIVSLIT
jgi:Family of unknown function (DUF6516)